EVWPMPAKAYQLIVVSQEPFMNERNGNQVFLGGAIAQQPETWLRELVRIWVSDSTSRQSELEQLVLADFLAAVAKGEFSVAAMNGAVRKGEQVTWQNSAIAPGEYCFSPWRDSKHFESCD